MEISLFDRIAQYFAEPTSYRIPSLLYVFVKAAACVFFICVTSGKGRLPRKIAASVLTFALMLAAFFVENVKASLFIWIGPPVYAAILFFGSLLCGEKKIPHSIIVSLIAVNAFTITDTLWSDGYFLILKKIIGSSRTHSAWYAIFFPSLVLLIAILVPAALLIKKNGIELKRAGTVAVTVTLLLTAIIIILVRHIVLINSGYLYYKLVSLSESRLSLNYLVLILAGILLLDVTVCVLILTVSRQSRMEAEYAIMKQQYEGQTALVEEVSKHQETVSRMRHDLSHTLGTVDGLIKQGKLDDAREYIEAKNGALSADFGKVNTTNEYVNALVGYETARAAERNIDVSVCSVYSIDFPDNGDLVSLLGNMFDNAINAAAECDGVKTIRLDIARDKGAYRISVLNSVRTPVLTRNPRLLTTKKDKPAHGYGTKIIREIAEKYYGSADFYDTPDGKFCCSVIVYPEKPF